MAFLACVMLTLAGRAVAAQTTVTALRGLDFGSIISGTTTTVAANSSSAMAFRISAGIGLSLGMNVTLPTTLTRVGGGGQLPVTFCSTCAIYRVNNSSPGGGTTFNPSNGLLGLLLLLGGDVYVWIGASTSPPLNQPAGSYTGSVVVTTFAII